ncbi:MAG: hypothetical protein WCP93_04345 [Candidatus Berkelbacteria bacterium]
MKNINDWLAIKLTKMVGSMWCAYLFAIIALISLPAAIASHNVFILVSWIAQTFLQLVLLSVIMVGQDIQSKKSEERTEKTLKHITAENNRILEEVSELLNRKG